MTPALHPAEARATQQQVVADLAHLILTEADLGAVFDAATRQVSETLGAPLASVFRHDADADLIRLVAGTGWAPGTVGVSTMPAQPGTLSAEVLARDEPFLVLDVGAHPVETPDLVAAHGVQSCICVAIPSGLPAPFGILGLHHTRADAFSEADALFVHSVALVLGGAVAKARASATIEHQVSSLEARVAERTQHVRQLLADLTTADQRERRTVARTLHDDLQQQLVAVQMRLQLLARIAEAGDDIAPTLAAACTTLCQAIETTRALTVDLSPPVLPGEGVERSIEWLAARMEDAHGLCTTVRAEGDTQAAPDVQTLLFQLVRELLVNVVRHSGQTEASVRVSRLGSRLRITVTDAGGGFDPAGVGRPPEGQFGLVSVRERLDLIGGQMHVASSPDGGTTVTLEAPAFP